MSVALLLSVSLPSPDAAACGATGHELVRGIAVEKRADSVPAFIRTQKAATEIAVMRRELDRSKDARKTHEAERDADHYVDFADARILWGN